MEDANKGALCLPYKRDTLVAGNKCYVIGMGRTEFNNQYLTHLKEAIVNIVSSQTCNSRQAYNGGIDDNLFICAGYKQGRTDACQADSGGPLSCKRTKPS